MKSSYDPADLNISQVIEWLTKDTYWAANRSPELIKESFSNSVPISIVGDDNSFLGVGRLVTDKCTFGWLCDVYVAPESRGKGVGHLIAQAAVEYFDQIPQFRLILKTRDAHGVYKDLGFSELENPDSWMAIEQGF